MIEEEIRVVPGQLSLFHPVNDLIDFQSAILVSNKLYKHAEIFIPIITDIFNHTEVLEMVRTTLNMLNIKYIILVIVYGLHRIIHTNR